MTNPMTVLITLPLRPGYPCGVVPPCESDSAAAMRTTYSNHPNTLAKLMSAKTSPVIRAMTGWICSDGPTHNPIQKAATYEHSHAINDSHVPVSGMSLTMYLRISQVTDEC